MDENFIAEHGRLVHYVANKYYTRAKKMGLDYDDIVSQGMIGLLLAYKRFDEKLGVQFSTYAVPTITGEILRWLRDYNTGAKFSRGAKGLAYRLRKDSLELKTLPEICEITGAPLKIVLEALDFLNQHSVSFEMEMHPDPNSPLTMGDMLGEEDDQTMVYVKEFLGYLKPRERKIVISLMDGRTQRQVGSEIGVSQVQISRILKVVREKHRTFERTAV